ncbi:hypothetical protein R4282_30980 [Rhodococcus oxybenzonivorans]|uniref:hypothetical protein n=1 Tax=Rhodococcus TaxID=1827 RepID=UPI00203042FA|nr:MULTISPECIES: hypothetical protein [Rhodococcus]MDV7357426.1 hypothetical protein [Rhodococcus oxybenzonivorans]
MAKSDLSHSKMGDVMLAEAALIQTNLFAASLERVILAQCLLITPELLPRQSAPVAVAIPQF